MKLSEYISKKRLTQAQFAHVIGESPQNICRYVNGDRIPEKESLVKIYEATDGKVTANDFYGLPRLVEMKE